MQLFLPFTIAGILLIACTHAIPKTTDVSKNTDTPATKNTMVAEKAKIVSKDSAWNKKDTFYTVPKANAHGNSKLKNGTYTFDVAFAEWRGESMGSSVIVTILRDSIFIIQNGSLGNGKKGDTIEKGVLVVNTSHNTWIVAIKNSDRNTEIVGGCSGGPSEINFKNRRWWTC